jgi:SAM-dependent methyltransferase
MENISIPDEVVSAIDGYITSRSAKEYFHYLQFTGSDMKKWKVVVDLGSGIEQEFARDCKKMGFNTKIISIDPRIAFSEKYDLQGIVSKNEIIKRRAARKNPQEGTISAIAQHLPLNSNSVDEILALYSVPLYLRKQSDSDLVFAEIARVLKVDGEARIFPVTKGYENLINNFIGKHKNLSVSKTLDKEHTWSYLFVITKTK